MANCNPLQRLLKLTADRFAVFPQMFPVDVAILPLASRFKQSLLLRQQNRSHLGTIPGVLSDGGEIVNQMCSAELPLLQGEVVLVREAFVRLTPEALQRIKFR
jgi:hypothetical protein